MTIVHLAMDLVLEAGASMRGAAAALELMVERLGLDWITPSFGAIRSWLLRVGCHALTCALPSGAWVWLADHTVQIGPCKLLVIMGCLLSDVPLGERPLRTSDLRLVHLSLMEHSTSATVAKELEIACQRTGTPRQIVSDNGSDLNGAVTLFQANHAGVAHVHDPAHLAANVLKQRWTKDDRWSSFVARLAQTGSKLRQTRAAHYVAPKIRAKARFMNVGPTLRFANRLLKLLDTSTPNARVEEHYAWLRDYRESLRNWTSEHAVAEATVAHVRTHGVGLETDLTLEQACADVEWTPGALEVATQLQRVICAEGEQAKPGEPLVASTEALESTFGKLKRLEGSYSGDGFTGMALVTGVLVDSRTEEDVRAALEAVPKKEAENIIRKVLGTTVHMFRRLFVAGEKSVPNPG